MSKINATKESIGEAMVAMTDALMAAIEVYNSMGVVVHNGGGGTVAFCTSTTPDKLLILGKRLEEAQRIMSGVLGEAVVNTGATA